MSASHISSSVRSPQRAVVPVVFVQRQVVRMASPGSTSTPTAFLPAPVLKLNDGASSSGVDVPPRTRRTNCADPTRCMWDQALTTRIFPTLGGTLHEHDRVNEPGGTRKPSKPVARTSAS